jgi:hypothetical protein
MQPALRTLLQMFTYEQMLQHQVQQSHLRRPWMVSRCWKSLMMPAAT